MVVDKAQHKQFQQVGVIVLPGVISPNKVKALAHKADAFLNTFISHVLANTLLPHYLNYEH
jgi:hypothetical protein